MSPTLVWWIWICSFCQVLPRDNGVRYPWNFVFMKCFWDKKSTIKNTFSSLEARINDRLSKRAMFYQNNESGPAVEAISLDMKQQELDGRYIKLKFSLLVPVDWMVAHISYLTCRCIQIRNLHKVYASRKGECCAVNSLQLTLYENQILALLGMCLSSFLLHIHFVFRPLFYYLCEAWFLKFK